MATVRDLSGNSPITGVDTHVDHEEGGGTSITGYALEATQASVLAELQTPSTSQPDFELADASDLTSAAVSRNGAGETTMVTATASQTTRLHQYSIVVPAAGTVEIRDGASGAVLRKHVFSAANMGIDKHFRVRPYAKTTVNTALIFYWSGTGQAEIEFDYIKSA